MDCLRSFSFAVDLINNVSGATNLKQWATSVGQHFWQASVGTSSTYNIQGFKNIDVYGVDVLGSIQTQTNTVINGVIVNDWLIDVIVNGQQPVVGGVITGSPNFYAIDATTSSNNVYQLGRYSNSVKFATPYLSAKSIQLGTTFASGIGYETLAAINLRWKLNVVVYYKFFDE